MERRNRPPRPEVLYLPEVDSTNTFLRTHFAELPDGVLVAAHEQTAGRGRCGRVWYAPPGTNVTATVKFSHLQTGFHAGCIAGTAVLEAVRQLLPEAASFLKWPNDVYVRERKLAGLLSEGVVSGGRVQGVVCGIGLNVNMTPSDLARLDQPGTSLKCEKKRDFDLKSVTEMLADELFWCYITYMRDPDAVLARWREGNRLIGREITVVTPKGERLDGVFSGIAADGALLLERSGTVTPFYCGDVKIDVGKIGFDAWRENDS